jgi:hypothetical protein
MKGKALVMVGILVLGVGVAIVGPMQVAAAQDYEHNWSWLAYTPEAHTWSAFDGEQKQHNWSATVEYEPHNWSNVLRKVVDEHDWSGVLHKHEQHNWSAFEGEHEQHDWSWMLPEPGETFNPNAGWWGIG